MGLRRPLPGEFAEGYAHYLGEAPEGEVLTLLEAQLAEVVALVAGLTEVQGAYRYATGKWSLKDLLQHLSDVERIFTYRCLRIGRGDTTPIEGFEEDDYAQAAQADTQSLSALIEDFRLCRQGSLALFRSLPEAAWSESGTTNGRHITARCFPYLVLGHAAHHLSVIRERYLPGLK